MRTPHRWTDSLVLDLLGPGTRTVDRPARRPEIYTDLTNGQVWKWKGSYFITLSRIGLGLGRESMKEFFKYRQTQENFFWH